MSFRSALKRTPIWDFNYFPIMFYILHYQHQNWRPILPCSYFQNFARCLQSPHLLDVQFNFKSLNPKSELHFKIKSFHNLVIFIILSSSAVVQQFNQFCPIQVVQEYERAVIFRLGRLLHGGSRGPGNGNIYNTLRLAMTKDGNPNSRIKRAPRIRVSYSF